MILIGIGANLPSAAGPPVQTCEAALAALEARGVPVLNRSSWYETAPVPVSDQPWYINGVAEVSWPGTAADLLAVLHAVEARFGRVRGAVNAPRSLDLDLLAFHDRVNPADPPLLPHPRLHERAFVLLPLQDIAPGWVHPKLGLGVAALIAALPPGQETRRRDAGQNPG